MKLVFLPLLILSFSPALAACGSKRDPEPVGVYPSPQSGTDFSATPGADITEQQTPASTPTPAPASEAASPAETTAEVFVELNSSATSGIVFNREGSMLVGGDRVIHKITPDGEVTEFCNFNDLPGAEKNYYFTSPRVWDMVVTGDDGVLAAAQDRILKISGTGEISTLVTKAFKGFLGASGIELDREGNIYVTDGPKIIKYDPAMEAEDFVDASELGIISFFSLKFSPDYKYLYASDFYTSSIWRIPINADGGAGTPELLVQEPIKNASPYGAPLNMIFNEAGDLYTSLDCKQKLLRMDPSGKTEMISILKSGENHYIAFGGKGFDEDSIYFTSSGNSKIYKCRVRFE